MLARNVSQECILDIKFTNKRVWYTIIVVLARKNKHKNKFDLTVSKICDKK